MVVDRLLIPSADADGRLAEDGRLVAHALRRLIGDDLAGLCEAFQILTTTWSRLGIGVAWRT